MTPRTFGLAASFVAAAAMVACSSPVQRSGFITETNATSATGAKSSTGFSAGNAGGTASTSSTTVCNAGSDPTVDYDGDGFTGKNDCNECSPTINAGAQDIPGNGIDEDCSGTPDDEVTTCDQALSIDGSDPFTGAAAIGLCKKADPNGVGWGVLDAQWVLPDGTPLTDARGYGILAGLGVNAPHEGQALLSLSSGVARAPGDDGFSSLMSTNKGYTSGTPAGYPKESPACPGVVSGSSHDGAALQVKIRVPTNAQSFSYEHFFLTIEYPNYICSKYNDFFVTMMDPPLANLPDGNIAFDQDTNPISVNNSLLQACEAGTHGAVSGGDGSERTFTCPLGTGPLSGTGFEDHGGTGWLTTSAPVAPGKEITLTFSIWDSGDGKLDSTVLVDNFKWSLESTGTAQTQPSQVK